jgi:hypothetical protein
MATKRQLVVYEADPAAPGGYRLFALDPGRATGIPIPAFREVGTLPPAGTTVGEAVIVTTSRQGYVWTGKTWLPIAPSPVITYPTEADLLADAAQPPGAYGAASDTGNLFIRTATGWRMVGIRTYANQAALQADAAADGALGLTLDDDVLWVRAGGVWRSETARVLPDLAAVKAWVPTNEGAEAISQAEGLSFIFTKGAWFPKSTWLVPTETALLAQAGMLKGQIAVAQDTGHRFLWDGTQWIGEPLRHYPTEADLLADKPGDGTLAWADDTSLVFARAGGAWRRNNSPNVLYSDTEPVLKVPGDVWIHSDGTARSWNGTAWSFIGGAPIGTISMWPTLGAMPPAHLLCDGAAIDPAVYPRLAYLCGPKLPDLRGQFVRGAKTQPDIQGFPKRQWTTGRPRAAFTTNMTGDHSHRVDQKMTHRVGASGGPNDNVWFDGNGSIITTDAAGNHTHTITGGGDAETAPDHVFLAYIIKAL